MTRVLGPRERPFDEQNVGAGSAVELIDARELSPVLLRRARPAVALVLAMGGLYAVMATVEIYQTVPFPSMVAGYSLALASSRRTTILAGLAVVPFVVAASPGW